MTPLTTVAVAACIAIGPAADQVLLRDLAPAFPGAQELSLETVIGLAPAPGVQRRFETAELRRIAERLKLPEPRSEVCVERPTAPLDPARLVEAMQAELPGARIELLEYSRYPVPDGVLELPVTGLRQTPAGAIWSGSVRYGGGHKQAVWARIRATVTASRVVAASDLVAGKPLDASALRVEVREEFPTPEVFPAAIEEVAGKVLRRPVRAGVSIPAAWLEPAKVVLRGDTVQVEVREGAAMLRFSAEAQGSGAVGQTVQVLNPMSNKRFAARVEDKGKVSVGKGLE